VLPPPSQRILGPDLKQRESTDPLILCPAAPAGHCDAKSVDHRSSPEAAWEGGREPTDQLNPMSCCHPPNTVMSDQQILDPHLEQREREVESPRIS
jgi:hypothetical protein